MSAAPWLREERDALATTRILDAAGEVFAEVGVAQAGMADVAAAAGCSRATVYRYFASRHALRAAYVQREAGRVAAAVGAALGGIDDPQERIVAGVLGAVAAVRDRPELAAWFTSEASGIAVDHAASSAAIEELAVRFLGDAVPGGAERQRCARWLVRVIVSLLGMPEESPDEEQALVARFVAPSVLLAPALQTNS